MRSIASQNTGRPKPNMGRRSLGTISQLQNFKRTETDNEIPNTRRRRAIHQRQSIETLLCAVDRRRRQWPKPKHVFANPRPRFNWLAVRRTTQMCECDLVRSRTVNDEKPHFKFFHVITTAPLKARYSRYGDFTKEVEPKWITIVRTIGCNRGRRLVGFQWWVVLAARLIRTVMPGRIQYRRTLRSPRRQRSSSRDTHGTERPSAPTTRHKPNTCEALAR